jgi:hypothetical protein
MKKHFPNILLSKYIRGNIAMQIYTYRLVKLHFTTEEKITRVSLILKS